MQACRCSQVATQLEFQFGACMIDRSDIISNTSLNTGNRTTLHNFHDLFSNTARNK
jgi:hypothetical protein